jgi:hypothetical protein
MAGGDDVDAPAIDASCSLFRCAREDVRHVLRRALDERVPPITITPSVRVCSTLAEGSTR